MLGTNICIQLIPALTGMPCPRLDHSMHRQLLQPIQSQTLTVVC